MTGCSPRFAARCRSRRRRQGRRLRSGTRRAFQGAAGQLGRAAQAGPGLLPLFRHISGHCRRGQRRAGWRSGNADSQGSPCLLADRLRRLPAGQRGRHLPVESRHRSAAELCDVLEPRRLRGRTRRNRSRRARALCRAPGRIAGCSDGSARPCGPAVEDGCVKSSLQRFIIWVKLPRFRSDRTEPC